MKEELLKGFFGWINERHAIYQRRAAGLPAPWTSDPILQQYKFTNPFRENDRVTVWMRENWTNPNHDRPWGEIIFNCCLFRVVGTSEFALAHRWVTEWNPEHTKAFIENRIQAKLRTFTGAYVITNQGLKLPKSEVVVDHFLTPLWNDREKLAEVARAAHTLEQMHLALSQYRGWGGGGFMAYEIVCDLLYTPVLHNALDRLTWANAGPGAKRGLNRLHERLLDKGVNDAQANAEMRELLELAPDYLGDHVPIERVDMRTIEHSLCEWDKYQRVLLGQGRPRSLLHPQPGPTIGPVK